MDKPLPCVLFALRREALFFWKNASNTRRIPSSVPTWCCEYFGSPILVVETGVGQQAMARALCGLFANLIRPGRMISLGFSGALQPGLSVGDLIWATELVDSKGTCRATTPSDPLAVPKARRGRLLTMPELVGDPEQKRLLGKQFQALAVDMETAEVARQCDEQSIPLTCLRVISDDWNTPLSPRLVEILQGGDVAPLRLLGAVLWRPMLIGELWRLGGQTHFAARQLAEGLRELLKTG
jgi:adenosylhomocysteine nucleosidase